MSDTDEPVESPAPRRRRDWLRRALVLVVVVAVAAGVTAAFSSEMREANAETAEVAEATLAIRVERLRLTSVIADARAELDGVWDERTVRRAERVNLDEKLETLYSKLLGLNDELTQLATTSQLHVLNLVATKQCLVGVQRALEQASVDDTRGSLRTLGGVRSACDRARAAGSTT
jgi:hypothetical protein